MPNLFMIGGPNGAGKTTSAFDLLPDLLDCKEYVNADAIAAALSPFDPESTAIQSGKLMLKRIHELAENKVDFAFETTLSARSFVPFLKKCTSQSYIINLVFMWVNSPEIAIQRVKDRVMNGGHNIPEPVIRRRYQKGINNLFKLYIPLAHNWIILDNSTNNPNVVAHKSNGNEMIIYDPSSWNNLKESCYANTL